MNPSVRFTRAAQGTAKGVAVLAVALSLSGCITLLPKTKPAQMYRFGMEGGAAPAPVTPVSPASGFGVLKTPPVVIRAAAGDRLMTVTGSEVAYIAEARWVGPAAVLFDEAVTQAFAGDAGPARLVARGDARKADYALRMNVRSFEARYLNGQKAAPDVVVIIDATLTRTADRTLAAERTFSATVRAGDNRVGPIVEAYNDALQQTLPDLVKWVDGVGPAPK